jgi:hypothetical protein
MSVEPEDIPSERSAAADELYEIEVLDGEVVEHGSSLEPVHLVDRRLTRASTPALQTAVAVATGFVAGAATLALLQRYAGRAAVESELAADGLSRRSERAGGRRGSVTYLVHVRRVVAPPE